MDPTIVGAKLREMIAELGMAETCRRTGLNAETAARLALGAAVKKGTIARAALALGLLAPTAMSLSSTPIVQA